MRPLRLTAALDQGARSWWFEEALADQRTDNVRSLEADVDVDVAIVGGGYTGLWTALRLAARGGGVGTAVLEAGVCGSQASGKNGGFVHGYWTAAAGLCDAVGPAHAAAVLAAGSRAQAAIAAFCVPRAAELWWRADGIVRGATTPAQELTLRRAHAAVHSLGHPAQAVALAPAQLRERVRLPAFRSGVFFPEAATVHPGRLVRALRAEAVARGSAVYEHTAVRTLVREGDRYRLITARGSVRARAVVLAINAALSGQRPASRHVTNFSSYAIMTDPAPAALAEHGWTGAEGLLDGRRFLHYFRTTPDGRVLMGTGAGPIGYGGRLGRRLTRDRAAIARAVSGLNLLLPAFRGVRIAGAWGGPIDVSSDHLPYFFKLDGERIFGATGYSGHGVNPSWIGGETLASLVLGVDDRWRGLPFVTRMPPRFVPEPLRYIGGSTVRAAIIACERADQDARRPPLGARALAALPRLFGLRVGTR